MNHNLWLSTLLQFLILLPGAASCYLPIKNQTVYTGVKTTVLCSAVLIPYCLFATWLRMILSVNVNTILLPSLCGFFFLYRYTVKLDLSRSLAIYVGVCAIKTFPAMFAYSFDAWLHPLSDAWHFSVEAALFQLCLSGLLLLVFIIPARRHFSWCVENLNSPDIWYPSVALSAIFVVFNIQAIPRSYTTLQAGRLSYLFPLLECCTLVVLISVYVLFYQGAKLILKHATLEERSRLLEMQSHQYQELLKYMRQTAKLRHDFRHSVRLLASLAKQGDMDSIQTYLTQYDTRLAKNPPANFCSNAALNALFCYYYEQACSLGIDTDWKIRLPEPLTISELDMASLFGNLMENAITGCSHVPEDSRYFCLTAEIRHGNSLYIVSTNRFDGNIRKENDTYYSTKQNGKGLGLASISAIAEKYHGLARISNNKEEFFVDVVLKL